MKSSMQIVRYKIRQLCSNNPNEFKGPAVPEDHIVECLALCSSTHGNALNAMMIKEKKTVVGLISQTCDASRLHSCRMCA